MKTRFLIVIVLLAGLIGSAQSARAFAIVNLCQFDDQPGPGTNLSRALSVGGLVLFNCGPTARIRITRTHEIALSTTIDGGHNVTLDAGGNVRMFVINRPDVVLMFDKLRLRGGAPLPRIIVGRNGRLDIVNGGIVANLRGGRVVVRRSQIFDTREPLDSRDGSLRVDENSQIYNNQGVAFRLINSTVEIEQSSFFGNVGTYAGSLTLSGGTLSVYNSSFYRNTATSGGAIMSFGGTVLIQDSTFSQNVGRVRGGAVSIWSGQTTIRRSRFDNNTAGEGGAIYLSPYATPTLIRASEFVSNRATKAGGAISLNSGTDPNRLLELKFVTFAENTAATGGAIDLGTFIENDGTLLGSAVTFAKNTATGTGGAINGRNVAVSLTNAFFIENRAGTTGAALSLMNFAPRPSWLANALIVQNATLTGSAVYGNSLRIINSTIMDNLGYGIATFAPFPSSDMAIRMANTIVAHNSIGNCQAVNFAQSSYVDVGHNLQFPGTQCGTTITVLPPLLGPKYDPLFGSPARSTGDSAICAAAPVSNRDIFGMLRPQWTACSIGAVEGELEPALRRPRRG